MNNKTVINKKVGNNSTVINNKVNNNLNVTRVNTNLSQNNKALIGTIINQKYKVLKKLDVISGEADLYLCTYGSKYYVAKIYRRETAIKQEVVNTLKSIDSPYVAKFYETGLLNGHTYEILPYYPDGSLQNKLVTYEELKKDYIPALIEGLKVLHDKGIFHKDLKPSNIMVDSANSTVAIIDFGISSIRDEGVTMIVTNTGLTPIYSAPETFRNVFLVESDYYSLGITLYELYTGMLPYQGFSQEELERMISVQRIPLPKNMPNDLKQLILGLTYSDISNRNQKNNPNRRWGYEEVKKWLQGIKMVTPGEGVSNNNLLPYKFLNKEYNDINELTVALLNNWDDGKKQLFRGYLTSYFQKFNPDFALICSEGEQKASVESGKDDYIFWQTMYKLNNKIKHLYWKGKQYNNLPALGRDILENLENNHHFSLYLGSILKNHVTSEYLKMLDNTREKQINALVKIEDSYIKYKNERIRMKNYYRLGFFLSGQKILTVGDMSFGTILELKEYMETLFSKSFQDLRDFCYQLIDNEENLNPQFEVWLQVIGKSEAVSEWRIWVKKTDEESGEVI